MCHSRSITRVTIMLYHRVWNEKCCWMWNILCTLARLVCGLLVCFMPYTSSIYKNCISLYYVVIIIDFLYAWYHFYRSFKST